MDTIDVPIFMGVEDDADLEFWIKWMEQDFSAESDFTKDQKLAMAWGYISVFGEMAATTSLVSFVHQVPINSTKSSLETSCVLLDMVDEDVKFSEMVKTEEYGNAHQLFVKKLCQRNKGFKWFGKIKMKTIMKQKEKRSLALKSWKFKYKDQYLIENDVLVTLSSSTHNARMEFLKEKHSKSCKNVGTKVAHTNEIINLYEVEYALWRTHGVNNSIFKNSNVENERYGVDTCQHAHIYEEFACHVIEQGDFIGDNILRSAWGFIYCATKPWLVEKDNFMKLVYWQSSRQPILPKPTTTDHLSDRGSSAVGAVSWNQVNGDKQMIPRRDDFSSAPWVVSLQRLIKKEKDITGSNLLRWALQLRRSEFNRNGEVGQYKSMVLESIKLNTTDKPLIFCVKASDRYWINKQQLSWMMNPEKTSKLSSQQMEVLCTSSSDRIASFKKVLVLSEPVIVLQGIDKNADQSGVYFFRFLLSFTSVNDGGKGLFLQALVEKTEELGQSFAKLQDKSAYLSAYNLTTEEWEQFLAEKTIKLEDSLLKLQEMPTVMDQFEFDKGELAKPLLILKGKCFKGFADIKAGDFEAYPQVYAANHAILFPAASQTDSFSNGSIVATKKHISTVLVVFLTVFSMDEPYRSVSSPCVLFDCSTLRLADDLKYMSKNRVQLNKRAEDLKSVWKVAIRGIHQVFIPIKDSETSEEETLTLIPRSSGGMFWLQSVNDNGSLVAECFFALMWELKTPKSRMFKYKTPIMYVVLMDLMHTWTSLGTTTDHVFIREVWILWNRCNGMRIQAFSIYRRCFLADVTTTGVTILIILSSWSIEVLDQIIHVNNTTLTEMKAYALSLEFKPFTKVLAKELNAEAKPYKPMYAADNKHQQALSWQTQDHHQTHQLAETTQNRKANKPRYLEGQEMEDNKKQGLCFRCDTKWSKEYYKVCPNRHLKLLTVVIGYEIEVLDKNTTATLERINEEAEEESDEEIITLSTLSQNAFFGVIAPAPPRFSSNKRRRLLSSGIEVTFPTSRLNTIIQTSSFHVGSGREPSPILRFESGPTSNYELEKVLQSRDEAVMIIKENMAKAQQIIKTAADKHRRAKEFEVGQSVYLKLKPYRPNTLATRICKKLSAHYFGPFKITERIGHVAYKLDLPSSTKFHNVFHAFLLQEAVGHQLILDTLPADMLQEQELIIEPELIRGTRYNSTGHLEAIVQWKGFTAEEAKIQVANEVGMKVIMLTRKTEAIDQGEANRRGEFQPNKEMFSHQKATEKFHQLQETSSLVGNRKSLAVFNQNGSVDDAAPLGHVFKAMYKVAKVVIVEIEANYRLSESEKNDLLEQYNQLLLQYPYLELGDKFPLKGGSIDRPFRVYFRKHNKPNHHKAELAEKEELGLCSKTWRFKFKQIIRRKILKASWRLLFTAPFPHLRVAKEMRLVTPSISPLPILYGSLPRPPEATPFGLQVKYIEKHELGDKLSFKEGSIDRYSRANKTIYNNKGKSKPLDEINNQRWECIRV